MRIKSKQNAGMLTSFGPRSSSHELRQMTLVLTRTPRSGVGLVKGAFSRARDFTATGVKKERKQDGVLRSCDA